MYTIRWLFKVCFHVTVNRDFYGHDTKCYDFCRHENYMSHCCDIGLAVATLLLRNQSRLYFLMTFYVNVTYETW